MTLWGGRFDADPDRILWDYTVTPEDRRLLVDDVTGSLAHVGMLGDVGLVSLDEARTMAEGLGVILEEATAGTFEFLDTDEDVHSAVERRLIELVGEPGRKLHTGRSRNDQVALDVRLYLRRAATDRADQLTAYIQTLVAIAATHAETVVPAYTHLQQAQAVPLGHHLLAYAWMGLRDRSRLEDLGRRLDVSPLGAGAAGGSSLPIEPGNTARALGFGVVFANSIDAVGSRDLVAEYVWCAAQAMVHLSRLSEELILWATTEFGWVAFGDAFTTGSSALPQKKNPDIAELARGRSAGAIGALTAILTLQKGLPLAYNRDLQEDKTHLFTADDILAGTLTALTGMLGSARFDPPPPSAWVTALDLAEAMVERGVPFREAHHAVGRLVSALVAGGRGLETATSEDLAAADDRFVDSDLERVDPRRSVERRVSQGGGSVASVHRQIEALRRLL
ncbi:MAG TPA: argininosuccinate lyase [Acidimicrobiia bacterium]|nr:argininosuccinate lyase [Acidimicrobiia bacterium]